MGQQILKPATAQMMHSTALNNIPPLNSMLLGFYQMNRNGHRIIGHAGDTQWFHSEMVAAPRRPCRHFRFNEQRRRGRRGRPHPASVARRIHRPLLSGSGSEWSTPKAPQPRPTPPSWRVPTSGRGVRRRHSSPCSTTCWRTHQCRPTARGRSPTTSVKDLANQPRKFDAIAPFVWRASDGKQAHRRQGSERQRPWNGVMTTRPSRHTRPCPGPRMPGG